MKLSEQVDSVDTSSMHETASSSDSSPNAAKQQKKKKMVKKVSKWGRHSYLNPISAAARMYRERMQLNNKAEGGKLAEATVRAGGSDQVCIPFTATILVTHYAHPWGEGGTSRSVTLCWHPSVCARLFLCDISYSFSPMAFKLSDMVTMIKTLN